MTVLTKIIGAIRIEDSTAFTITNVDGGAVSINVPIAAGVYFLDGNGGADDLLKLLQDAFDAAVGVNKVRWLISSDYRRLQWAASVGSNVTFTRTATSSYLDEILRWPTGAINITPTIGESTRTVYGIFAPDIYLMRDEDAFEAYNTQWDNAFEVNTLSVGGRNKVVVSVKSTGLPHSDEFTEYHDLVNVIRVGATGFKLRLYRQADLSGSYDLYTNQLGYVDMVLEGSSIPIDPTTAEWYKYHSATLKGWLDTEGGADASNYY